MRVFQLDLARIRHDFQYLWWCHSVDFPLPSCTCGGAGGRAHRRASAARASGQCCAGSGAGGRQCGGNAQNALGMRWAAAAGETGRGGGSHPARRAWRSAHRRGRAAAAASGAVAAARVRWPRSSPEARSGVCYMPCGMRAGARAELAASATRGRQKPLRSGYQLEHLYSNQRQR